MSGMDEQLLEKLALLQQTVHRLERDNVALRRRLAKLVPRASPDPDPETTFNRTPPPDGDPR